MSKQNNLSLMQTEGQDLSDRWRGLLDQINSKTGFISSNDEAYRQSRWWRGEKVGAVILEGQIELDGKSKAAILKIQGTKPNISETEQIQKFQAQNLSQIIRPPHIYAHLPWNEEKQFEALVFEKFTGKKVLDSKPVKVDELNRFFEIYSEYRENCIQQPWLDKPNHYSFREQLEGWQEAVIDQAKQDPFDLSQDQKLIDQAIEILDEKLTLDQMTFQHGHLSTKDFVESEDGQVIILSNLFWGWRLPYYDAVFAYHWHMLSMEHVEGLNPGMLVTERDKWLKAIYSRGKGEQTRAQIDFALLERTVVAILIDRYMLSADPSKPYLIKNQPFIVEFLRGELERLVGLVE